MPFFEERLWENCEFEAFPEGIYLLSVGQAKLGPSSTRPPKSHKSVMNRCAVRTQNISLGIYFCTIFVDILLK
ncbi:hypothetical protein Desti_3023 [Desulfomonile tiedjei DSM 6799]|uniref:Uncharacterized protein n=1 Tax=Desulfomonile tiedjei (strain ATCC 49306 / DSM 6799 / DCB-1) TaxID=706587 RepID=I4C7Z6_DESTA|nr:hypothetical protein Desti_3023 [Desulfomonile tiedjei DSM 6799]